MPHVLLVEDDDGIRTLVTLSLERAGLQVTPCASGEEALERLADAAPDALVVDLMLGAMDGFTLIEHLRRRTGAPIVVVSALTDSADIVHALRTGADEFITKPFDVAVLQTRLRALLPREGEPATPTGLTHTEGRLLAALAARPGRVMTKEMLLDAVWQLDYFGDERLVDTHVERLRPWLEANPTYGTVDTVEGQGYRFVPPVED